MDGAVWGIIMLVVFPLLQFPVMVYLSRRVETDDEVPPPVRGDAMQPSDGDHHPSAFVARSSSRPSVRTCPRCGTDNAPDAAFTHCRNCATRL